MALLRWIGARRLSPLRGIPLAIGCAALGSPRYGLALGWYVALWFVMSHEERVQ